MEPGRPLVQRVREYASVGSRADHAIIALCTTRSERIDAPRPSGPLARFWTTDGLRAHLRQRVASVESLDPSSAIWDLVSPEIDRVTPALFNLLVDNGLVSWRSGHGEEAAEVQDRDTSGPRLYRFAGADQAAVVASRAEICDRAAATMLDALAVLPSLAASACRTRRREFALTLRKIDDAWERIRDWRRGVDTGPRRKTAGGADRDRGDRVVDRDRRGSEAWRTSLRERLYAYIGAYFTPDCIRWGHVHTRNNISACPFTLKEAATAEFVSAVETVAAETGKSESLRRARTSVARGSPVAVVDFGDALDVSAMLREPDLRRAHEAAQDVAESCGDESMALDAFILLVCAQRVSLAKCVAWRRDGKHYDTFSRGCWVAFGSEARSGASSGVEELARSLVVSTVGDLERARTSGSARDRAKAWLRVTYPRNFVQQSHLGLWRPIAVLAGILRDNAFLKSFGRLSKPTLEIVDPSAPMPVRWLASRMSAVMGVAASSVPPKPPRQDRGGRSGSRREAPSGSKTARETARETARVKVEYMDGEPESMVLWTERFDRGEASTCAHWPPLDVLDTHLRASLALGPKVAHAVSYLLVDGSWRFPADQHRGSVVVWTVTALLGYRGMRTTAFCARVRPGRDALRRGGNRLGQPQPGRSAIRRRADGSAGRREFRLVELPWNDPSTLRVRHHRASDELRVGALHRSPAHAGLRPRYPPVREPHDLARER